MRERLSVEEQLARKREFVKHLRAQTYSAEEVVNAYARCFYAAISNELLTSKLELEVAHAEGIHPRHAMLLYKASFEDIDEFIYCWLGANPQAALKVAQRIVGMPSLTHSPERETTYDENHMAHVKKIEAIVKSWPANQSVVGPFAIRQLVTIVEMLYTLLEIFNHSHELSPREQETMPATLPMLAAVLADELACLKLPRLAPDVSYGEVHGAGSSQHTAEFRYSKDLWANELASLPL